MPEIQIDVAVANRFISSLSKSLQALCHGCMDFDSGIEIVGYINVNIDSGSKVDYVLNEKVLKSTTNSMTFVSNSFFAKKEQPKQSRDGSCSPIPELVQPPQMMSPYQSRMRGSHPRTGAPFSQAYGMRGSHKRSWASMERDWRISPKRQREGRPQYPMSHDPSSSSSAQSAHFSAATSSSQNPADPNFGWTQPSAQSSDTLGSDTQSNVNIKKEVFDSDTDGASAQTEQEQSQSADQTKQDNSDPNSSATGINIKRDPDASTSAADEETAVSEGATTDTDFKGTFLQPSTETPHQEATAAEESDNTAAATEEEQDISQTETSNQNSAAENTSDNHEETASSEMIGDNVTPASDMPVEFDEAGEEGAYPQSVYSDLGEGSSDAGQFEVIEIDDEDEDVQAMFGESRVSRNRRKRKHPQWVNPSCNPSLQSPVSLNPQHLIELEQDQEEGLSQRSFVSPGDGISQRCSVEICSTCRIALPIGVTYQQHFTEAHATETAGLPFIGADPYICEICQKGFITKERLRQHATVHDSAYISCYICDVKLKHKKNLKRHLESTHSLRKCPHCYILIPKGKEYDSHCKTCSGDQESNGV